MTKREIQRIIRRYEREQEFLDEARESLAQESKKATAKGRGGNRRKKRASKPIRKRDRKRHKPATKKRGKPTRRSRAEREFTEFNLCGFSGREAFYDQIKSDFGKMRRDPKITDEDLSGVRFVIDIGFDIRTRTKKGKPRKLLGHRVFKGLTKLERFLGISFPSEKYKRELNIDWSGRGLCQYKKRAHISIYKMRGERVIGEKILKRYKITGA